MGVTGSFLKSGQTACGSRARTANPWTRTCSGPEPAGRKSCGPGQRRCTALTEHSSADPRVALLTGTNRGTGRAIATALHDSGWRIISLNRTLTGEEWLGEVRCDLAELADLEAGASAVLQHADHLHACILNAAVRRLAPVADLTMTDMMTSIAVNLLAPFRLTQLTLPLIRHCGRRLRLHGKSRGDQVLRERGSVLSHEGRPEGAGGDAPARGAAERSPGRPGLTRRYR